MKKTLVLFLVLSLFSGCQKKEDVVLRCEYEDGPVTNVMIFTFSGDYKRIVDASVTITATATDSSEAKEVAERLKKEVPDGEFIVEDNKVTSYKKTDEVIGRSSKEHFNYIISTLESDGFVCEIKE